MWTSQAPRPAKIRIGHKHVCIQKECLISENENYIIEEHMLVISPESAPDAKIPYANINTPSTIVHPISNGCVYIFLFINIEIKTFGWHIQKLGVVLITLLSA